MGRDVEDAFRFQGSGASVRERARAQRAQAVPIKRHFGILRAIISVSKTVRLNPSHSSATSKLTRRKAMGQVYSSTNGVSASLAESGKNSSCFPLHAWHRLLIVVAIEIPLKISGAGVDGWRATPVPGTADGRLDRRTLDGRSQKGGERGIRGPNSRKPSR